MSDIENDETKVSRRDIFGAGSAAVAAAALILAGERAAEAQQPASHTAPNEVNPGQQNGPLAAENPDSEWCPPTDNGNVKPFKYSFSLSRKRLESGGWTRQVTVRDLPISTTMAGVEMRLTAGGVRELHWHVEAEWAIMLYGSARITAVDQEGRSFVSDVSKGDLWLFPPGIPHSIQGLGPDGCKFLLVFDDGNFDEFHTFLITDWLAHTPKEVLAKNFSYSFFKPACREI
jgi:oxalate decarboxylase